MIQTSVWWVPALVGKNCQFWLVRMGLIKTEIEFQTQKFIFVEANLELCS
jgi:hypothetical protein